MLRPCHHTLNRAQSLLFSTLQQLQVRMSSVMLPTHLVILATFVFPAHCCTVALWPARPISRFSPCPAGVDPPLVTTDNEKTYLHKDTGNGTSILHCGCFSLPGNLFCCLLCHLFCMFHSVLDQFLHFCLLIWAVSFQIHPVHGVV